MKTLIYLFCSLFLFSCIDYSLPDPIDNTTNPPIVDDNSNPYLFDFTKGIDLIIYNQMGVPYRNDDYSYSLKKWGKHDGVLPIIYNDWRYGSLPQQWMNPNGKKAISAWGRLLKKMVVLQLRMLHSKYEIIRCTFIQIAPGY